MVKWKRVVFVSLLVIFLLPFAWMIPPAGTSTDQARLDRLVAEIRCLEQQCNEQKLKQVLGYTADRYNQIGRFGVRILPIPLMSGVNVPWCPGLTISPEAWTYDDKIVIQILVHEAMHDYYPYFGHYHMWGTVNAPGYYGETELERLLEGVYDYSS
jgi:hypothetical protein